MNSADGIARFFRDYARKKRLRSRQGANGLFRYDKHVGLSFWIAVRTTEDRVQRSGYPDLRIVDLASKRVFYLDPKLYAAGSRDSSFRTFYFEPKIATNKVRNDAVHFVAGFEHEPRKAGHWNFTRWDLVDLSQFKVKVKAEFQGSNHDMYRPEAIVATSAK